MGVVIADKVHVWYVGETAPYRIQFQGAATVSSPSIVAVYDSTGTDRKATVFPTGSPSVEDTNWVKTPNLVDADDYVGQQLLIVVSATVDGRTQLGAGKVAIRDAQPA